VNNFSPLLKSYIAEATIFFFIMLVIKTKTGGQLNG